MHFFTSEVTIRNRDLNRKLRGMVVMFQEEMSRDARKAGEVIGKAPDGNR